MTRCIILTLARIITILHLRFTTKSNTVSNALRAQKTKCTEVGTNPGAGTFVDAGFQARDSNH